MHLAKFARVAKQTVKKVFYSTTALVVGLSSLALAAPLFLSQGTAYAATANIDHLAFTTTAQAITAGTSSSVITVQTQNSSNGSENLDTSSNPLTVTSSSSTGEFSSYSSGTCSSFTTGSFTATMASGTANKNFCYKDSTVGTYNLTATLVNGSDSSQTWSATQSITITPVGTIDITNATELRNAIENQADGQTWTIEPGTYAVTATTDITESNQTGWYFPITASNITINGVGNPTIYGSGYTANGAFATQDLVAIFGSNVTINGVTLMPKVEPNKTIEVLGNNVTIENTTIKPNTLVDQSEYNNLSDPTEQYWGGSIYYNGAGGTQTLSNVTIDNGGVSYHAAAAGVNLVFTNVALSYSTNTDWINSYRYSNHFDNPTGSTLSGTPQVTYHVSSTLNNLDDVLANVQNGDIISLDSNLTTTQQITLTKAVTLDGNGYTISPNFTKTSNSNNAAIGIQSNDVTIKNLVEDGTSGTNLHGVNIYESTGVSLDNVTIKNNGHAGMIVNGSTVDATDFNTSGNTWGAVNVDPGSGVTDPSVFTLNSGTLSESNQIWSDGSNVTNTATVKVNATGYNHYYISDTGYNIWTNKSLTNIASITNGSTTDYYSTIQAAVNTATSGQTINVAPGTYSETVSLTSANNDVTLDGGNASTTTITGGIKFSGNSNISGVAIKNLTFKTSSGNTISQSGSNYVYNLSLDHDVFNGQSSAGMAAYIGSAAGTFSVTNTEVTGYTSWGNLYIGENTLDAGSSGPYFTTVTFQSDNIHDNRGSNVVYGNLNHFTQSFIIKDNHFTNNGYAGSGGYSWASIEAHNATSITSSGNVYSGQVKSPGYNEGAALYLQNDDNSIVNAQISNDQYLNNYVGVEVWAGNANGVTVRNSTFSGNGTALLVCRSSTDCTDTTSGGAPIGPATGTFDASDNWWGSATPNFSSLFANGDATYKPYYLNSSMTTLSNTASLASLSLSSGTLSPTFSSGTTSYTASVANSVSSVSVSSTATVSTDASISGNGSHGLSVGSNTINLTVTSADGTQKTYTITITRAAPAQTVPDSSGNATVNNNTPQLIVNSSTQPLTVNVSSGTSNATIDYSALKTSSTTAVVPQTTINTQNANVQIQSGTTITASSSSWNGVITAPTVQTNTSITIPTQSGQAPVIGTVIEVGAGDIGLTFNKAVRLLIPNQAGKLVGFIRAGSFTQITTQCSADSQAAGNALPAGGDCYIYVGNDAVVWTKHFTEFVTYTKSNTYVVQPGDTFFSIALKFNLTLAQLEALNPSAGHPAGNFSFILPGDVLKVGSAVETASASTSAASAGSSTSSSSSSNASVLGANGNIGSAASTKKPTTPAASTASATNSKWYWWVVGAAAVVVIVGSGYYIYRVIDTDKKAL